MNDNDNNKLLKEYDETQICVYDEINNASLSGSTSNDLPGAATGWYLPGAPED